MWIERLSIIFIVMFLSFFPNYASESEEEKNPHKLHSNLIESELWNNFLKSIPAILKDFQRQEKKASLRTVWQLDRVHEEDKWLDNESIHQLLLKYLKNFNPELYVIVDPVDVSNNWWDLTAQILRSIDNQLTSGKKILSQFMIVPINFGNMHWATMIMEQNFGDISNPTIYFFDSLGSNDNKLETIKRIIEDTQKFLRPSIVDLSSQNLIQKDGSSCGTWMLEAATVIIEARQKNHTGTNLRNFFQTSLASVSIEVNHARNLLEQMQLGNTEIEPSTTSSKNVKHVLKRDIISEQEVSSAPVEQQSSSDEPNNDLWRGEGKPPKLFSAKKTAEAGHPNSKRELNNFIAEVLKKSDTLSLKELHEEVYKKLFELPIYQKTQGSDYAFYYDTNLQKVYSCNFIHLLTASNEPLLLRDVLTKTTPNLLRILDTQRNNILHIAAYFGFHEGVKVIIEYSRERKQLSALINARNNDGTNPLGMLFLNSEVIPESRFKTAEHLVLEPSFEINHYLNNKKGMDVFAPRVLKGIGGFNCLHIVLQKKYDQLWGLLLKRYRELQKESNCIPINFLYPAMNPNYHMWHPSKFASTLTPRDVGSSQRILAAYQKLIKEFETIDEGDESGDSDEEDTSAWHYKKGLERLGQFLDEAEEIDPTKLPQISTILLNSPSRSPLTPEQKTQVEEDITKVAVVHFHGVPFMQGQLTNADRRAVGRRFIAVNKRFMEAGLKSSEEDKKLKTIYTRTTMASQGIENHKMLIDASEEQLSRLTRTNAQLKESLEKLYRLKPEEFLSLIQSYIVDFTAPALMSNFWNFLGDIPKDIVRYRFPLTSTAKSPDHAFKYGMGYNVEESLRGEKSVSPHYVNGRPKHRLAGFLYLVMSDIESYRDMENSKQLIDAVQHHKAQKMKLGPRVVNQSETTFLGGISGENITLVVPLLYLNFSEKNKELYTRIFGLSEQDWNKGKKLNGSIQQLTQGNNHTADFKLLLKIYLPFVIKLAKTIAHLQGKVLYYIDSLGDLMPFSEEIKFPKGFIFSAVQTNIKDQVSPQTPEGKRKTPTISRRVYHDIGPRVKSLQSKFVESLEEASKEKKEQEKVPLKRHDQSYYIGLFENIVNNSDKQALSTLESLANQENDPEAQFYLGRVYRKVKQDDRMAVKWYTLAAQQGHMLAQFYLGWMYETGHGVLKNIEEAIKWYKKAADQGDERALTQLKKLQS